jgi:hypothetical protein
MLPPLDAANTCDKVGTWVFLHRFHWDWGNSSLINEAEKAWIEKNKAFIKDDAATPKKIFATYCEHMGLTEEQVIDEIDWDFSWMMKLDSQHPTRILPTWRILGPTSMTNTMVF